MSDKDVLRQHMGKIVQLNEEQFDYFFSFFRPISFKKEQTIITIGDTVDCEYFVLSGCLKTFVVNDDLKMHILQFATQTWWASDYNALYNAKKATVNLDCVSDTRAFASSQKTERKSVRKFMRWRLFCVGVQTKVMLLSKKEFYPCSIMMRVAAMKN